MTEDIFAIIVGSNVVEMFPCSVLAESCNGSVGWADVVNSDDVVNSGDVNNLGDVVNSADVLNWASVVGWFISDAPGSYRNIVKVNACNSNLDMHF